MPSNSPHQGGHRKDHDSNPIEANQSQPSRERVIPEADTSKSTLSLRENQFSQTDHRIKASQANETNDQKTTSADIIEVIKKMDMPQSGKVLQVTNGNQTSAISTLPIKEIAKGVANQFKKIENDIDSGIEAFLASKNQTFAKGVWRMIHYFKDPKEGFKVLKDYMDKADDMKLKDAIRENSPRRFSVFRYLNHNLAEMERAIGKNPNNPLRAAMRAGKTLLITGATSLFSKKFHGDLTFSQLTMVESFTSTATLHKDNEHNPLLKALEPQLERSLKEITSSYESLEQYVKGQRTMLTEQEVRAVRDEVIEKSKQDFTRITSQSFNDSLANDRTTVNRDVVPMSTGIKYGVELEGFIPSEASFVKMKIELSRFIRNCNIPVSSRIMPKSDLEYNEWDITFDSSVVNPLAYTGKHNPKSKFNGLGLEFVSPILEGQSGSKELGTIISAMRGLNVRSNETCGMHVHVDLRNIGLDKLKNLGRSLIANETKLDMLTDPDRRDGKNKFCQSIPPNALENLESAQNIKEFVEAMNPNSDRNHMFDFTGLVVPGTPDTIQYRGEGGANYLDTADKYVRLLVNFTQQALEDPNVDVDSFFISSS